MNIKKLILISLVVNILFAKSITPLPIKNSDYFDKNQSFYIDSKSKINDAIFTSDGRDIISASDDGLIRLWNIKEKRVSKIFEGHTDKVNCIAISSNQNIIISGSDDGTIRIWDRNSTNLLRTIDTNSKVLSIAFTQNSQFIVAGLDNGNINLWLTQTGEFIKKISKKNIYPIKSIYVSKHYIVSTSNKTINLWRIQTGELIKSFVGNKNRVLSIAISKNERYIVSGSENGQLKIWNLKSGKIIKTLKAHTTAINSVAITSDNRYIISASGSFYGKKDNSIKIWNRKTKKLITTIKGNRDYINSINISKDNRYIVFTSGTKIKIWSISKKKLIKTLEGDKSLVTSIDISKDNRYILSSYNDNHARLWDLTTKRLIHTFYIDNIHFASFSGNSRYIVFGAGGLTGAKHSIKVWDRKKDKFIKSFKTNRYIVSLAVSTGRYIVATLQDSFNIKLWDRKRKKYKKTLIGHIGQVNSVDIDKNGDYIVSGSDDKTIKIWNRRGKILKTLKGHTEAINSVCISHNGKYIVSTSDDKSIKLWNRKKAVPIKVFLEKNSVKNAKISSNNHYIVSTTSSIDEEENNIKVWNIQTGKSIWEIKNIKNPIKSLEFIKNRYIVSSSKGIIDIWDINSSIQKPIYKLIGGANKRWIIFDNINNKLYINKNSSNILGTQ